MDQFLERCESVLRYALGGLLAFITFLVFIQVCMRYFFNASFLWGEELSLFAFIWCVFIGAAIAVRRRAHFAFDFLANLLSGRVAGFQRLLVDLIILGLAVLMLVQGHYFSRLSVQRFSPAVGITLFIPTIIIPVSAAYMILGTLRNLFKDWRQILGRDGG